MSMHHVTVYTSNNCKRSDELIHWLEQKDVDYTEKNISEERAYLEELQNSGVFGTPAAFVNNQTILGFQPNRMKQELNL